MTGALFDVNLDGKTYQPCAAVGTTSTGGTRVRRKRWERWDWRDRRDRWNWRNWRDRRVGFNRLRRERWDGSATSQAPANTHAPTLSGTAKVGKQAQTSKGSWSGSPTAYTYAWQRCKAGVCTTVKNATKGTYSIGSGDVGYQLVAIVTAKDAAGATEALSAPSAVVAAKSSAAKVARLYTYRRTVRPASTVGIRARQHAQR